MCAQSPRRRSRAAEAVAAPPRTRCPPRQDPVLPGPPPDPAGIPSQGSPPLPPGSLVGIVHAAQGLTYQGGSYKNFNPWIHVVKFLVRTSPTRILTLGPKKTLSYRDELTVGGSPSQVKKNPTEPVCHLGVNFNSPDNSGSNSGKLADPLTHLLTHSSTHALTHPHRHPLTHLLTHPRTHDRYGNNISMMYGNKIAIP